MMMVMLDEDLAWMMKRRKAWHDDTWPLKAYHLFNNPTTY
jgi:hypothetical protein